MADFEVKDGVGIIPEGTTIISVAAFKDCKELTSVVIPDSVQEIGALAFAGTNIASIVIPEGVKEIGAWAFQNCVCLTNINLPSSVLKLESGVFKDCTSRFLFCSQFGDEKLLYVFIFIFLCFKNRRN